MISAAMWDKILNTPCFSFSDLIWFFFFNREILIYGGMCYFHEGIDLKNIHNLEKLKLKTNLILKRLLLNSPDFLFRLCKSLYEDTVF